jgi:hypothetical protein
MQQCKQALQNESVLRLPSSVTLGAAGILYLEVHRHMPTPVKAGVGFGTPVPCHLRRQCGLTPCAVDAAQEMFLGRLTIEESHAALERLVRHVMIKAVFMSAVVDAPDPAELAMWLAWFAPLPSVCCREQSCRLWGVGTDHTPLVQACWTANPAGCLMRSMSFSAPCLIEDNT